MMIAQLFPTTLSHNFSTVDYQLTSRRQVLSVVGTGTTVALAGCSGNRQGGSQPEDPDDDGTEQDNGSNSDQSDSDTEDASDKPEATGNDPSEYPRQETTGNEAKLDSFAEEDPLYSFKIDDYNFLNIREFSDEELEEIDSYEKALYAASFDEDLERSTKQIYFLVDTRANADSVNLYSASQEEFDIDDAINLDEEETPNMTRQEFLRGYVDPDGIVHAVDLAEHNDAVEALHSGWKAE